MIGTVSYLIEVSHSRIYEPSTHYALRLTGKRLRTKRVWERVLK